MSPTLQSVTVKSDTKSMKRQSRNGYERALRLLFAILIAGLFVYVDGRYLDPNREPFPEPCSTNQTRSADRPGSGDVIECLPYDERR